MIFLWSKLKSNSQKISNGTILIILFKINTAEQTIRYYGLFNEKKLDPIVELTKREAQICAGENNTIKIVDYCYTYYSVVSCRTIRLIFVMPLLNGCCMQSIDFIIGFTIASTKKIFINKAS